MPATMYMISGEGGLVPMKPVPFAKEEEFQRLLEKYPELLTGDQIDPVESKRWVLVKREMGVPGTPDAVSWLSLDHLYLDQRAVPTLVEVKRAENTELRRKVVAQMLDYAANAVVYWPPEEIRSRFENRVRSEGRNPDQELVERLGINPDSIEEFWNAVARNLRSGTIRMLFVADVVPPELRRIVEFLNEQMNPAVVLAVELQQFAANAGNTRTLVPRIFGQTERALQEKKIIVKPAVPEITEKLANAVGGSIGSAIHDLVDWSITEQFTLRPTSKNLYFGCKNYLGDRVEPFSLDTDGVFWGQFGECKKNFPFNSPERMRQLKAKFAEIPNLHLSNAEMYPTAPIKAMSLASFDKLKELLVWARGQTAVPTQ